MVRRDAAFGGLACGSLWRISATFSAIRIRANNIFRMRGKCAGKRAKHGSGGARYLVQVRDFASWGRKVGNLTCGPGHVRRREDNLRRRCREARGGKQAAKRGGHGPGEGARGEGGWRTKREVVKLEVDDAASRPACGIALCFKSIP